jgi:dihydroflavonol-4-reductase
LKALVTGSTGFIGGAICRRLVEQGMEVRAFHRETSSLKNLEGLAVEHVTGDLTRPETLEPAMQGVEVVFHAAALLGARDDPGRMYAVTVEGTRAILRAARKAGVRRLIHTSSVAALGVPEVSRLKPPVRGLLDESHAWNYYSELWSYGYAKYLAELEVQKSVANGLDAVIVNPSVVMGAGDVYRKTSSVVVQIASGKLRVCVEGGVNIVHIEDVVSGHLAALQYGRRGARYILCGTNLPIPEMTRMIAEFSGLSIPLVVPAGLVRSSAGVLKRLESFLPLPISAEMLNLAGYYFYYDGRKAQRELRLDAPLSAQLALQDAFDWFVREGALTLPRKGNGKNLRDK